MSSGRVGIRCCCTLAGKARRAAACWSWFCAELGCYAFSTGNRWPKGSLTISTAQQHRIAHRRHSRIAAVLGPGRTRVIVSSVLTRARPSHKWRHPEVPRRRGSNSAVQKLEKYKCVHRTSALLGLRASLEVRDRTGLTWYEVVLCRYSTITDRTIQYQMSPPSRTSKQCTKKQGCATQPKLGIRETGCGKRPAAVRQIPRLSQN